MYFQNVHLQCKNNSLLEYKSSADIYVKRIMDTEKKLCENDSKRRKKFNKIWKNVLVN